MASLKRTRTEEKLKGELPCSVILVRAMKTMVSQMRTLVGRKTTAKAARQSDARRRQSLPRRTLNGFEFSLME